MDLRLILNVTKFSAIEKSVSALSFIDYVGYDKVEFR
jgi:hypothetical protein